jgi:hypothetical protein
MAIVQSAAAKGKETPPAAYQAGIRTTAVFAHTFTAAFTAASDKLEIGMIPANVQVISAQVFGDSLGAITADVGIMSGTPGSTDNARTVGTELFNDQSVTDGTIGAAGVETCLAIARSESHRGLGVTLSGNVAAPLAGKRVVVVLDYIA